eukprot:9309048-Prorocentrum_lima.AAC.1
MELGTSQVGSRSARLAEMMDKAQNTTVFNDRAPTAWENSSEVSSLARCTKHASKSSPGVYSS